MSDTLEPDEEEWKLGPPINFTEWSVAKLQKHRRWINDKLVEMDVMRPFVTPTTPKTWSMVPEGLREQAKDLHSQYFAVMHALYKKGIKDDE